MVKNLNEIIHSIYEGSILFINDTDYKVLGMSSYTTKNNPEMYYKIFLENDYVLVIIAEEEFVYFGQNIGDSKILISNPIQKEIEFEGKKYIYSYDDFQGVEKVFFGTNNEGELNFWDYESEDEDDNSIISFGLNKEGKRADVIAEIIDMEDIELDNK